MLFRSIFDVLARDADAIMAGKLGTFKERTFPNDPKVHGRRTMHGVVLNEDYGGDSASLVHPPQAHLGTVPPPRLGPDKKRGAANARRLDVAQALRTRL